MPQTPPFSAMFDSSGYNRNLYQSSEDSCGGLYYHDNNLLSGSLEALIQHLVPNVDYYPDVGIPFLRECIIRVEYKFNNMLQNIESDLGVVDYVSVSFQGRG